VGYGGESRWWHDPLNPEEVIYKDKLFENRTDAENWLEPRARKSYEYELSDMSHNDPEHFLEMKAEYERLGGFQIERKEDRTLYWGPPAEHEDCRTGCIVASVEKEELILEEREDDNHGGYGVKKD
jgi:hypothetical protein